MPQHIAHISMDVDDYDEAINFYTKKLNFGRVEGTILTSAKRWVLFSCFSIQLHFDNSLIQQLNN
jgi:catechol 2,3-dioxygenase-like lactoylglutathione lyase family enzyme